jgi:hypothetical protein
VLESTDVPSGHSRRSMSWRVTTPPACSMSRARIWNGCCCRRIVSPPRADLVPSHVDLDAADANDGRGQRRARHRPRRVRTPPEISERRHIQRCMASG